MDLLGIGAECVTNYQNITLSLGLCHNTSIQPGFSLNLQPDHALIGSTRTFVCFFLALFIIVGLFGPVISPLWKVATKGREKRDAPQVPYLIPVIGNLITFLLDPAALASSIE